MQRSTSTWAARIRLPRAQARDVGGSKSRFGNRLTRCILRYTGELQRKSRRVEYPTTHSICGPV